MKSQQTKKRLEREAAKRAACQLAREQDDNLMALYMAFLPMRTFSSEPKFSTDKYGNRVLTELLKEVGV